MTASLSESPYQGGGAKLTSLLEQLRKGGSSELHTTLSSFNLLSFLSAVIFQGKKTSDQSMLKEALDTLLLTSWSRHMLTFHSADTALFLCSLLAELLNHSDQKIVLLSYACLNNVLRIPGTVAAFRTAWLQAKSGHAVTVCCDEITYHDLQTPLLLEKDLLKMLAASLKSSPSAVQIRSWSCLSSLMLTNPENQLSAKLFGASVLSRLFPLCVESLQKAVQNIDMSQSALVPDSIEFQVNSDIHPCGDLLADLLGNSRLAEALLKHGDFTATMANLIKSLTERAMPPHLLRVVRHFANAIAQSSEVAVLAKLVLCDGFMNRIIEMVTTNTKIEVEGGVQELCHTLIALQRVEVEANSSLSYQRPQTPIAQFIDKALQELKTQSLKAICPNRLMLLTELMKNVEEEKRSSLFAGLTVSAMIAKQQELAECKTPRDHQIRALLYTLTCHIHGQSWWGSHTWVANAISSCVSIMAARENEVHQDYYSGLQLWMATTFLSCEKDDAAREALAQRLACLTQALDTGKPKEGPKEGLKRKRSDCSDTDTDMDMDVDMNRGLRAMDESVSVARIKELEAENRRKQERLDTLTAEYASLESSLSQLRTWSQKSALDAESQEELTTLREFRVNHLAAEALSQAQIKELKLANERTTKQLEDTFMKLILLTKAHQKAIKSSGEQSKNTEEKDAEVQRLQQILRQKEDEHRRALTTLQTQLEKTVQDRIVHSKASAESLQGLEGELSKSSTVNNHLRETNAKLLAKVESLEERCRQRDAEFGTLDVKLKESDERARDLDNKLQRYSHITTFIHNLSKDPENARPPA